MSKANNKIPVRVEYRDQIATVSLCRSDARNALNSSMLQKLHDIARGLHDDYETRAVVLRSEGDTFSVGADLNEISSNGLAEEKPPVTMLQLRRTAEFGAKLMQAFADIPQPVICAIQGISTGGATCIASACDFRIASRDARMGYGEVKLGMNLMWNAVPTCIHLVGPSRAKQMIMTGRLMPADTLERWGFIDEVCERDQLDDRAQEWAKEYVALPPNAVQMIKRSINRVSGALDQALMHADSDQWLLATKSEDFKEAVTAFIDKRDPNFTGN